MTDDRKNEEGDVVAPEEGVELDRAEEIEIERRLQLEVPQFEAGIEG
ncbi:hypothetical protein [Microbacterium sp. P01]